MSPAEVTISARDFARAGGSVTLTEWRDLTEEERAVFLQAQLEADEERAELAGRYFVVSLAEAARERRLEALVERAVAVVAP